MSTPPLNALVTKIREAHPGAYDDMDDATLTKKVLAKYPQYSDLAAPGVAKPSVQMDTGEGPIARNMTSFETQLSQMPKAALNLLVAKHWPIIDSKNTKELWQDIKSLNPVMREYEGGGIDWGATAANLLPMLVGAKEKIAGGISKAGDASEMVRKGAQTIAGASPERTTLPMVEDFKAKSAEATGKQVAQTEAARSSESLGKGIKELDAKMRERGNANYAAIREKVGADPGVPLVELSREARNAEKLIKGSTENIKQFRELIRKAPESEGVQTSAGFTQPGDPLYDQLVSEGAINQGGNLPFDELQGYSTEIGMKLSKGGLPGDVYQALKYLKGKIDAQKAVIAERNGVGPQLREADGFWRNYMETFYDTPSAVAASRERVGQLDPEFYSEPFVTGKSAKTGIQKLRNLSGDFPEADKLANLAEQQRVKHVSPTERIEQPKPPTVDDVRASKTKEIRRSAQEIGHLNRYDAGIIASSAIGPFFGRWETLLIDPAYLAARKGVGRILDKPSVQKWLQEPSAEDLRILDSLPPEAKKDIAANMRTFVKENKVKGVSPAVQRFLVASAAVSSHRNAGDMLRSLQGKPPGVQRKAIEQMNGTNPAMPVGPEP